MPAFQYKGRDARGQAVNGRLEAASAEAVAAQLFQQGITPVDIAAAGGGGDILAGLGRRLGQGRVKLDDLIFFCRQMYTLQRAGVPIMQALRGLSESARNPTLAKVIEGVLEGLDSGLDLNSSFRRYPRVFSPLFVSLVHVGETTGNLDEAFLQLAQYLELEKDTRQRMKSAVRYPLFVVLAISAAMVIINLFVIPAFAEVYAGFNAELPWATRIIIGTSNFMLQYWPFMLAGLIATVLGFAAWVRTPAGRRRWDRYKLRIPIVGGILKQALLGRFGRGMAMTMKAGVPLVKGFTVISRALDNAYVGEQVLAMREGIERGESITRTAAATGMFPAIVLQMISVGEESGALDELMEEVAGYYEREVDYALKNLSTALEPVLIIGVGGLVLLLALGVFLPMWNLASVMGLGR